MLFYTNNVLLLLLILTFYFISIHIMWISLHLVGGVSKTNNLDGERAHVLHHSSAHLLKLNYALSSSYYTSIFVIIVIITIIIIIITIIIIIIKPAREARGPEGPAR